MDIQNTLIIVLIACAIVLILFLIYLVIKACVALNKVNKSLDDVLVIVRKIKEAPGNIKSDIIETGSSVVNFAGKTAAITLKTISKIFSHKHK